MALSIHSQAKAVMDALARDYEIIDEDDVLAFLERYPEAPALLAEIREALRRYFGDEEVKVRISRDPEWEDEDPELYIYVQSHLGPGEALEHLDRFDDEWWIAKRASINMPIVVSIHLFKRV